jgi:hypothetical protein|tara:strand:- start:662 stop:976 length:315 start_codon:yes stop_codon:yes gene_type:complete
MKLIYSHDNIMVLHVAKNLLALNDIVSFVKNEHTMPNGSGHGIGNVFLELWINHDEDYAKASKVIDSEIVNPIKKDSWNCEQCQEENDGGFEICWNCQGISPLQ